MPETPPRSPHDPTTSPTGQQDATHGPGGTPDDERPPIVDWGRTARRMRTMLTVIGTVVLVAWGSLGVLGDGPDLRLLAELVGFGLLAAFAAEVVVVGGSAVRGLLEAGARGDRLASSDVTLLPPQLSRRRRATGPHGR